MNFAPLPGIPQLISILENNNVESKVFDLNSDFFENQLNETFFKEYVEQYKSKYKSDFMSKFPENYKKALLDNKYQDKLLHSKFDNFSKNIDFCRYILKNKKTFYNPILCHHAISLVSDIVDMLLQNERILIEKYLPGFLYFYSNNKDEKHILDIELFKHYITSNFNTFFNYLNNAAEKILKEKPDCIGISINLYSQFFCGLLLAYLIKQKSKNIHINIGGSIFGAIYKDMTNLNEIIETFCDTITYGNGDSTVLELCEYLQEKRSIETIHNIIYTKGGKLIITPRDNGLNLSKWNAPSFNGYNQKQFLSPEFVIPIQASVACYWGKCKFCVSKRDRKFQIKNVNKFVEEIQFLKEKYNSEYFYMWDNAIPPEFLNKFADLIIEKKIKIVYSLYARFEKGFNTKLLNKLKKSGCIKINWGLDSSSEKILNSINKGINLKDVRQILKDTKKSGILSTVSLILGYPYETYTEMIEDANFLIENKKFIDTALISPSLLFLEGSTFTQNRKEVEPQIKTNLAKRREIQKKIQNNFKSKTEYFNLVATYNLLYQHKYSNKLQKALLYLYTMIMKNNYLFKKLVKIHNQKYKKIIFKNM